MKKLLLVWLLLLMPGVGFAQRIVGFEYWFDAQYSQKLTKSVSAADGLSTIVESLDVPTLNDGMHFLSIRFSDNNGKWSCVSDYAFFRAGVSTATDPRITTLEYWFDADVAKKTSVSVVTANDVVTQSIDLASIASGIHWLSMRFQDNNGLWSGVNDYVFFKAASSVSDTVRITKFRYWYDSDVQHIVEASIATPATMIELQKYIDITSGSPDQFPLSLQLQFQDNTGLWSAVYTKTFQPEPSFETYRTLNSVSFRNTTNFSRMFRWNFGDGSTDTTANPHHVYQYPGVYTVTLTATNSMGTKDTSEVVEIKGLREVVANRAGNTGDVSLLVYGGGFDRDASVWLEGPETIHADTSYVERLDAVYGRFDLRGKSLGLYDVVVQFPGDTVMRLPKAFTIEAGTKPQPFVSIDGRNKILFNRWQSYQITIGNSGNVDASGVPLFIVISKADGMQVDFTNLNVALAPASVAAGLQYLLDTIPLRWDIDELFGEAFNGSLYVFYIPSIPANSSRSLELRIRTNQSFRLYSWMNEPYFQSPFDDAVASCINEAIAWYALEKGLDLGLKFIPGAGCLKNIGKESYGMMTRVIERKIGKDANGKPYKGWGDWAWGWGNWIADMTAIGVGCAMDVFPPTKAAKFAYASYKTIIELNKIKKDVRKLASADEKCREKFKHLSKKDQSVSAVSSFDPNELVGPSGYTEQRYTHNQGTFDYTIFFENKASATAPAQEVIILDTLDPRVYNLSTFSFGAFAYGGSVNHPLSSIHHFTVTIDSVRNGADILRVNGSVDTSSGIVTWQFITLNPATMDYPDDPDAGFLPPNKVSPEGEGYVSFSVRPRYPNVEDSSIGTRAKIIFDLNEPIFTNSYANKLDLTPPVSRLTAVYSTALADYYRFSVEGSDARSGIRYYTLYGSRNDSAYIPLMISPDRSFYFQCDSGVVYRFFTLATDSVGNEEAMKTQYEQSTFTVAVQNDRNTKIGDEIQVYPNPAGSTLTISYTALTEGSVDLCVSDPLGRSCVQSHSLFSQQGANVKTINVETIPTGLYLLNLRTPTKTLTTKILISR